MRKDIVEGANPFILITGIKHSGTTFMAEFLDCLGFDLGPADQIDDWGTGHGREWHPWRVLSGKIGQAYAYDVHTDDTTPHGDDFGGVQPSKREFVRGMFRDQVEALEFPELVKMPDFSSHLMWDIINPKLILIMHRPPDSWIGSMANYDWVQEIGYDKTYNYYSQMFGLMVNEVETMNLSYEIISYPRIVQDEEYAIEKMQVVLDNFLPTVSSSQMLSILNLTKKPELVERKKEGQDIVIPKTDTWEFLND